MDRLGYGTYHARPWTDCFLPFENISSFRHLWSAWNGTHKRSHQVRGFRVDKSDHDVFEDVNVFGNINGLDIHHNNFGFCTYGHQQKDGGRNKMHGNSGYGFEPHDDSNICLLYTSPSPRD